MCNACNHPHGCTCGWGGEGHLGGGHVNGSYYLKSIHYGVGKFETYVNPNAKCLYVAILFTFISLLTEVEYFLMN